MQAARADAERSQNEAQTYANRVLPEARGEASRIDNAAQAYRERTVVEARGQAARFLKVFDEYAKAKEVTRERMYLETMERVLGGVEKVLVDPGAASTTGRPAQGGVVPVLPLNDLLRRPTAPTTPAAGSHAMKNPVFGGVLAIVAVIALVVVYSSAFIVNQTQQALVLRLGDPLAPITTPGLHWKLPFIDSVVYIDNRILDLENPSQEVIASDQKRLVVDAFARYRITNPLRFYQAAGTIEAANSRLATVCSTPRCAECWARTPSSPWSATSVST